MNVAGGRLLWIPVGFSEAADRIVALVERGTIAIQPHWLSREACQSFIDHQPRLLHASYVPTAAIIRVAGDAEHVAPAPRAMLPCGSGKHFTEGADGLKGGPLPVIGSALADRALGEARRGQAHA